MSQIFATARPPVPTEDDLDADAIDIAMRFEMDPQSIKRRILETADGEIFTPMLLSVPRGEPSRALIGRLLDPEPPRSWRDLVAVNQTEEIPRFRDTLIAYPWDQEFVRVLRQLDRGLELLRESERAAIAYCGRELSGVQAAMAAIIEPALAGHQREQPADGHAGFIGTLLRLLLRRPVSPDVERVASQVGEHLRNAGGAAGAMTGTGLAALSPEQITQLVAYANRRTQLALASDLASATEREYVLARQLIEQVEGRLGEMGEWVEHLLPVARTDRDERRNDLGPWLARTTPNVPLRRVLVALAEEPIPVRDLTRLLIDPPIDEAGLARGLAALTARDVAAATDGLTLDRVLQMHRVHGGKPATDPPARAKALFDGMLLDGAEGQEIPSATGERVGRTTVLTLTPTGDPLAEIDPTPGVSLRTVRWTEGDPTEAAVVVLTDDLSPEDLAAVCLGAEAVERARRNGLYAPLTPDLLAPVPGPAGPATDASAVAVPVRWTNGHRPSTGAELAGIGGPS